MEEKIFCQNCGSENDAGSRFCVMCGCAIKIDPAAAPVSQGEEIYTQKTEEDTANVTEADAFDDADLNNEEEIPQSMFEKKEIPTEKPTYEPTPVYVPAYVGENVQQKKRNTQSTEKPKRHIAAKIFAALLAIILFAAGLIPTVLYPVHSMLDEDNIKDAVMDADIYEVVEDLIDGEDVGDFIIDSVHVKMQGKLDPSEKQIKKLLEDEDVKEFVADKLADFAEDIKEDNGDGKISSREIYEFVKDNIVKVSKAIGHELTDAELTAMKVQIEKGDIDSISIEDLREGNPELWKYISFPLSELGLFCSYGIVILLALLIFIICIKCVPVALKTVGIVFFINGGIALLVKPAYAILTRFLGDYIGRFTALIENICAPLLDGFVTVGLAFLITGAALILINLLISLVKRISGNIKAKRAAR